MDANEPEYVDLSQLPAGADPRTASLSPELLEHAQAVFDVIGPNLGTTLEQFEINLMRDSHPENEVVVGAASLRLGSTTTKASW